MRARVLALVASLASVLGATAACGFFAGIDGLTIGECKGGPCPEVTDPPRPPPASVGDGGGGGTPDGEAPCPGKGAAAVRVGGTDARYCIDVTEVTRGQYAEFLAAAVDPGTQPTECAWNTTFAPDEVDAGDSLPITGVDWCDARAYCAWAGKYLCGKFENGKKTGPIPREESGGAPNNQWVTACSEEGKRTYSYGAAYEPARCNLAERDAGELVPAASLPECVGGYPGLFDMLGNAWEWYDVPCVDDPNLLATDEVAGPQNQNCRVKGGAFINEGAAITCAFDADDIRRDLRATWLGFRCCSD